MISRALLLQILALKIGVLKFKFREVRILLFLPIIIYWRDIKEKLELSIAKNL